MVRDRGGMRPSAAGAAKLNRASRGTTLRLVSGTAEDDVLARLRSLSNGERALALAASDMPTRITGDDVDDAAVWAWIAQGYARLGPALLAELDQFSRRVAATPPRRAGDPAWTLRARMWGGRPREATATETAYRVGFP